MILSRRALLALLAARPLPALAAAAGKEVYVKVPPIALEFWDQAGIFHVVNIDLSVVFIGEGKVEKVAARTIQQALSAMAWEDFIAGNPAATVKAVALDIIRKQKSSEKAIEVLVIKMMSR